MNETPDRSLPATPGGRRHGGLPNLGFGGTLVAAFVTSMFAAFIGDSAFVILVFGPHAFFIDGLHVADWKHGILSNGMKLRPGADISRALLDFVLWMLFIGLAELVAGLVTASLRRCPLWATATFRLIGGLVLFSSANLLFANGFKFPHPIPLSLFIAGIVLIWKGSLGLLRRR